MTWDLVGHNKDLEFYIKFDEKALKDFELRMT